MIKVLFLSFYYFIILTFWQLLVLLIKPLAPILSLYIVYVLQYFPRFLSFMSGNNLLLNVTTHEGVYTSRAYLAFPYYIYIYIYKRVGLGCRSFGKGRILSSLLLHLLLSLHKECSKEAINLTCSKPFLPIKTCFWFNGPHAFDSICFSFCRIYWQRDISTSWEFWDDDHI